MTPDDAAGLDAGTEIEVLDELLAMERREHEFTAEAEAGARQLEDMDNQISVKEAMLLQLRGSLERVSLLRAKYEEMKNEVAEAEREREQLHAQLVEAQQRPKTSTKANPQAQRALKTRLDAATAKLTKLQAEQRSQKQLVRLADREVQRVKELEGSLDKLKANKVALMRSQKAQAKAHRDWMDAKSREVASLRKSNRKQQQEVGQLKLKARRQELVLQRRNQTVEAVTAKLHATEAQMLKLLERRRLRRASVSKRRPRVGTASAAAAKAKAAASPYGRTPETPQRERELKHAELSASHQLLDAIVGERVRHVEVEDALGEALKKRAELMRAVLMATGRLQEIEECVGAAEPADRDLLNAEQVELRSQLDTLDVHITRCDVTVTDCQAELTRLRPAGEGEDGRVRAAEEDRVLASLDLRGAQHVIKALMSDLEVARASEQQSERLLREAEAAAASSRGEAEAAAGRLRQLSTTFEHRVLEMQAAHQHDILALLPDTAEETEEAGAGPGGDRGAAVKIAALQRELADTLSLREELRLATQGQMQTAAELEQAQAEMEVMKQRLHLVRISAAESDSASVVEEYTDLLEELWGQLGVPQEQREECLSSLTGAVAKRCEAELDSLHERKAALDEQIARDTEAAEAMRRQLGAPPAAAAAAATGMLQARAAAAAAAVAALQQQVDAKLQTRRERADRAMELTWQLGHEAERWSEALSDLVRAPERPDLSAEAEASWDAAVSELSQIKLERSRIALTSAAGARRLRDVMALGPDELVAECQGLLASTADAGLAWEARKTQYRSVCDFLTDVGGSLPVSLPGMHCLEVVAETLTHLHELRMMQAEETINAAADLGAQASKTTPDLTEDGALSSAALGELRSTWRDALRSATVEAEQLSRDLQDDWETLQIPEEARAAFRAREEAASEVAAGEQSEVGRRTGPLLRRAQLLREERAVTQERVERLGRIADLVAEVAAFHRKIKSFERSASDKARLFSGKSTQRLEEERFRKSASSKFPRLVRRLKMELSGWGCDFDLALLGSAGLEQGQDVRDVLRESAVLCPELMQLSLVGWGASPSSAAAAASSSSSSSSSSASWEDAASEARPHAAFSKLLQPSARSALGVLNANVSSS